MDFIKAIILGIIEGMTEFLPVSSTGHLILAEKLIPLTPASFSNAFMVIIQLGAILAVVALYWQRLYPFSKQRALALQEEADEEVSTAKALWNTRDLRTMKLWKKVIVGVIPAGVLGFLFDDYIDAKLFKWQVVVAMLIIWGVIIIVIERRNKKPWVHYVDQLSYRMAFAIGLWQCLAMVPGTSRSAATVMGAVLMGVSRTAAAEFSFFLAIPTMFGATLLKIVKIGMSFSLTQWLIILVGFIVSFIVAMLVIRKFMSYIKEHTFIPFGYYRIALAIVVTIAFSLMG